MTIVPLKIYFNEKGRAKIEIGSPAENRFARQREDRKGARTGAGEKGHF